MPRTVASSLVAVAVASAILASVTLTAQTTREDRGIMPRSSTTTATAGAPLSPATRRIEAARAVLAKDAKRTDQWNELALALARRARETGDAAFYKDAWQATERSLALEPANLEGRKLQVWILLGQHEFPRAVEAAEQINRAMPDDVLVYGFLVDGYVELGRYAEAEKAAQWMLDLRPGNVPGLTRAAYLRELFGDAEGAVELLDTAYRRTPDNEVEDRAWILTHIAQLSLQTCRTDAAERLLSEALALFPDYHYALAQMAEVRQQQGRLADAAALRERHYHVASHPENQFELGVALERAGRSEEARAAWEHFTTTARAEMAGWDNANLELAYYYADYANRPGEALAIARRQAARRQDVRTLEALAWTSFKSGDVGAAQTAMKKVLDVGVLHPVTFYRAGAIAAAAGDASAAKQYLDRSIGMCGTSAVASEARSLQATLSATR